MFANTLMLTCSQKGFTSLPSLKLTTLPPSERWSKKGWASALCQDRNFLAANFSLTKIPLSAPGIQRPLGIVKRRHTPQSSAAKELESLIRTSLYRLSSLPPHHE